MFLLMPFFCQERSINTVDGRNPAPVGIPNIYRALYIPGGAGFLPSTVCHPVLLLDGQRGVFFVDSLNIQSFQSLSKRENFSVTRKTGKHYKRGLPAP